MTSAVDAAAAQELLAHRPMLFGLAYRLLGSVHDAEDVLQEAYLRLRRVPPGTVTEPRRYLTRIVSRLALDQLRARQARRESYVGPWLPEPLPTDPHAPLDGLPEESAERRDTISVAMLHLMERLSPPERAVYVLRTAFDMPYSDIAEVLDRDAAHCRQLYHRAAAALATGRPRFSADRRQHARLLDAFVAAARDADLDGLRALLHDDVTTWSDGGGQVRTARRPVIGAEKVARYFAHIYGRAGALRADHVEFNGAPGLLVIRPTGLHALAVAVVDGAIAEVYVIANPHKLALVAAGP